jgi:23S rRNA-/tRNA-specific pseudouridylate synthase
MCALTAVIPAAGRGTRLFPLTYAIPKEMLPLGPKPAIQLVVEELLVAGVKDFVIDRVRRSGGKSALTRYRVIRAFGTAAALVECRLATGRTHQIRVHLASIGHPVIGDPVYGKASRIRRQKLSQKTQETVANFGRQALHATRLGFRHPITGKSMTWDAPDPLDFGRLIAMLESV